MQEPLMTSLQEIARYSPCNEGWVALLDLLGEPYEHGRCKICNSKEFTTPFKVSEIGKLGNLEWLCWTWCLFKDDEAASRVYAEFGFWCAYRVRHLLTDDRIIKAFKLCREYLAGTATLEEIKLMYTSDFYMEYLADTATLEERKSNSPEQICSKHAAYSVSMVTASLAGHTYEFESAAYHAAEALGSAGPFLYGGFWEERSIQLAKLMELLDRGVRNEAPSNLPNETGHEL